MTINGQGASFWGDKNVLMVVNCGHTKIHLKKENFGHINYLKNKN